MRITIIGAGPGGYTAAFEAARRGADVTLVESDSLGGTCLNRGCIPTKAPKTSAEVLDTVRRSSDFGIACGEPEVDMKAVIARKRKVIETLKTGLKSTCGRLGVHVVMGRGLVVDASLVRAVLPDGSVQDIRGDKVIIATGSSALDLPGLAADGKYILTSDDALELTDIPARMLVVGGGVVGCELGFIFRSFGSEVTIVEGLDRLLPMPSVDVAMSKVLMREARKRKITVLPGRTVKQAVVGAGSVTVSLEASPFLDPERVPVDARTPVSLDFDCVLTTIGRRPNTGELGLAEAGVETDRRGYIMVDGKLETSLKGVYAIGDVLGPKHIMLAHVAMAEAKVAVDNCFGASQICDYSVVPSGIFTTPEIGDVGLTEAQAVAQGYIPKVASVLVRGLGKAHAMGELDGEFRLVMDSLTGRLLGAHISGPRATDLIAEAALALKLCATAEDVANTIHAHPTMAEGIFEAASQLVMKDK